MICADKAGLHGAPHSGAALLRRSPAEQSSGGRKEMAPGVPVRGDGRGMAGAHIAELIKTMLERKASGIELAREVGA